MGGSLGVSSSRLHFLLFKLCLQFWDFDLLGTSDISLLCVMNYTSVILEDTKA